MAPRKRKFPKDGIPRRRRDPRQDRSGKYPRGFDRKGMPITCGVLTEHGECPQPIGEGIHMCDRHYEERMRRWRS